MLQIELPGLGWVHSHIPEAQCDAGSKPVPHEPNVHDLYAKPDAVHQHGSNGMSAIDADSHVGSQHDVEAESCCTAAGKQKLIPEMLFLLAFHPVIPHVLMA